MTCRLNTVDIRIRYIETVAVPQRKNDILDNVAYTVIAVAQVVRLYNGRMNQEQAKSIRTEFTDCLNRVGIVTQRF